MSANGYEWFRSRTGQRQAQQASGRTRSTPERFHILTVCEWDNKFIPQVNMALAQWSRDTAHLDRRRGVIQAYDFLFQPLFSVGKSQYDLTLTHYFELKHFPAFSDLSKGGQTTFAFAANLRSPGNQARAIAIAEFKYLTYLISNLSPSSPDQSMLLGKCPIGTQKGFADLVADSDGGAIAHFWMMSLVSKYLRLTED